MPTSKSSIDRRDVYYRKGKAAGYRARSAYKLLHLHEEFDLFSGVSTAVDLCAAPGSWSQVLGQKLKPGKGTDTEGSKVVSIDLQPMAPLPNITILQTDITLPSTIPLVLDALGGRKADLVVCDGAPDVTGVHDLDAYLHSQLLLAALTLSLTLLAPHSTLIFKIFLSPLDPQAALLCSQLRCFFPGPLGSTEHKYEEFDIPAEMGDGPPKNHERERRDVDKKPEEGFDLLGRRGGVWVRKPRSSRAGSGEAFILCRNFDSSRVPLPTVFSESALAALRRQTTGTLTLDSLSSLNLGEGKSSKEWEMIKGYVGGGDLNSMAVSNRIESQSRSKAVPITLALPTSPSKRFDHLSTSPTTLFAQPTPIDEPPEYFSPTTTHPPSSIANISYLSPPRVRNIENARLSGPTQRAAALAIAASEGGSSPRQSSMESLTSNPSPTSLIDPSRPWAANAHVAAPSPHQAPLSSLSVPSRFRSHSSASAASISARENEIVGSTPLVSPALSSSSKTDLFFASSQIDILPAPPRPLPNAAPLGRGLPSEVKRGEERSTSMPSGQPPRPRADQTNVATAWADTGSVDLTSPAASSMGWPGVPEPRTGASKIKFGFEEMSTSRSRSISSPAPPHSLLGVSSPSSSVHSPATSQFLKTSVNEPLATLPSLPDSVNALMSPSTLKHKRPSMGQGPNHGRRESQQLERELREAGADVSVHSGLIVSPEAGGSRRGWRLIGKLGEGAFSAVWSATPSNPGDEREPNAEGKVAALKLMDRHLSLVDSRTRISFLREVEVLRHISHPSIVSYLDSFTTPTHHVLVLEELAGGELFDLMSVEENRKRMLLPSPVNKSGESGAATDDRDGEGFVRRVFGELTKAVGWLHEVGVVHRDIKLENILFTINPFLLPPTSTSSIPLDLLPPPPQPLIKLTDFGLSRFISASAPLLQTRCGSESFAAPEIIMGKSYDGRETDAWAMGVVLYGLIVGELPFDREDVMSNQNGSRPNTPVKSGGDGEARVRGRKRMMRIAKGEYTWPQPQDIQHGTSPGSEQVRDLVGKLLVRDPKKRIKVARLWDQPWMNWTKPGGLERPTPTPTTDGNGNGHTTSSTGDSGGQVNGRGGGGGAGGAGYLAENDKLSGSGSGGSGSGRGRRRVLDGFLVEEDGIEEVARAET
ncbi:hypothetical protein IAR55_006289 [Kwoniella newhampshirensis]|uniref:Protein kinase domain-containing protein n=1 Tax=Kwoniella newhampshirensis TaxID=1651941 RepID=A0AAW0YK93_9TREE